MKVAIMLRVTRPICLKCVQNVAKRDLHSVKTAINSNTRNRHRQIIQMRTHRLDRVLLMPLLKSPTFNSFHTLSKLKLQHGLNFSPNYYGNPTHYLHKEMSSLGPLGRLAGRLLKLRYLVLGSAVGGGVALQQRYEDFKKYLPNLEWMSDVFPDTQKLTGLTNEIRRLAGNIAKLPDLPKPNKEKLDNLKLPTLPSLDGVKDWIDEAFDYESTIIEGLLVGATLTASGPDAGSQIPLRGQSLAAFGFSGGSGASKDKKSSPDGQDDVMQIQVKYQKEVDRLEKENRELRKQLLLKDSKNRKKRKMKKALIDMYSEVLDELADYDSSYNTQDHLPRVVVVGDQSAGKTSVLEMIAQARIFPRGSGEMMTRSPVKVTLSEGPYHIAKFKDSTREYDLTKESELAALRREVEVRMKASVQSGQTISCETIAMTVKGPGIPRMVLVDLPGIISTVTTGMALDTKNRIQKLCRQHMENPNAIILCIQDGSLDAERSNVTDLVSSMDPTGKRTIFVLTKVDLAERDLINPQRIQKILQGNLFPMKALGYFAVVTGRGNTSDSISSIKTYEQEFFSNSKLFREGVLMPHQMNTHNLSMAVSDCFWKMVRESAEQQADAFKATRFNLETEWKNTYPRIRELDREELFEKARNDILDEIINLSQVSPQDWEEAFNKKLWHKMSTYVFENVYLPASQADSPGIFNTSIDIKLKQWADKNLPKKCVEVGVQTLQDQFSKLLDRDMDKAGRDNIFDSLKSAVNEISMERHAWDEKAEESLRVIQMNTLEDRSVTDKNQWDAAIKFMETALKEKLDQTEVQIKEMTGPGTSEQWMYWKYRTPEQRNRSHTLKELEKLLNGDKKHKPQLSPDEVTTVRKNLETQSVDVKDEFIRETWHHTYRRYFFRKTLSTANDCKKGFYYYQRGFTETGLDCHDVVLFWRIQRMLQVTSNALRQQVMNNEARRLERNIKDVLEEIGDDKEQLQKLLTGKRVLLAEELKRVRQIQELLEEFVLQLNKEKS